MLGRLRNGLSVQAAEARLDSVSRALEKQYPEANKNVTILISPLQEELVGSLRPVLLGVFAGSPCVLLVACANLANLFGSRGIQRQREMAIRACLGASQIRLLRQLLTEGMVITVLGAAIGLVWGSGAVRLFVHLFNDTVYFSLPRKEEIGLDWRLVAFAILTCILTGSLFSIVPAWHSRKAGLAYVARTGSLQQGRLRALMLTAEIALSLALTVAAGLLTRSYARLQDENLGFSSSGVLTATVALPQTKYGLPSQQTEFFRR